MTPAEHLFRRLIRANLAHRSGELIELVDSGVPTQIGTSGHVVHVLDSRFYSLIALRGHLGAAEAYRLGFWQTDDLPGLFRTLLQSVGRETWLMRQIGFLQSFGPSLSRIHRRNTKDGSRKNIEAHYDLGNDLFELFLDPTMTYSCGIFDDPSDSLERASENKLRRVCDLARLEAGMNVVETGTGWGSLAVMAAEEYRCRVTSVTLSQEQFDVAKRRVRERGLEKRVTIHLQDYRDLSGRFDRLLSVEMIEAIGHNQLPVYFRTCSNLLESNGLMVLQSINMPDDRYGQYLRTSDLIRHYIFPGSCCPSKMAIESAIRSSSDLTPLSTDEIGPHYAETLRRWRKSFVQNKDAIIALGYPQEFVRLWEYYFCYCEAGFEERYIGVTQSVFCKPGFVAKGRSSRSMVGVA